MWNCWRSTTLSIWLPSPRTSNPSIKSSWTCFEAVATGSTNFATRRETCWISVWASLARDEAHNSAFLVHPFRGSDQAMYLGFRGFHSTEEYFPNLEPHFRRSNCECKIHWARSEE